MKPTKYNYDQIFKKILPVGMILLGVTSCSVSQQTVGENDGIYYDPSSQPTKQVVVEDTEYQQNDQVYTYQEEQPIRMGGRYFDDSGNAPDTSQTTQQESRSYNDDSVIVTKDSNGNYNDWGDYEGVEIHVNNYFGPNTYNWNRRFYGSWYGPYRGFGWNFGWNSWGYSPFYAGYYGFGYPNFGYGYGYSGFYGPFHPYYGPYYYGSYGYYGHPYYSGYYGSPYYSNNYYGNRVMREIYRGKGIQNGITRDNVAGNRSNDRASAGVVRDNTSIRPNSSAPRNRASSSVDNNTQIRTTPTRATRDQNVSSEISTNPVRIRPRTTEEVNTNSGVRNNTRVNPNVRTTTPTRQNEVINTPRPQRRSQYDNNVPTRTPKATPPPTRNRNYNSTPSRRSTPSFQSTPPTRTSTPVRSSGGVRRR